MLEELSLGYELVVRRPGVDTGDPEVYLPNPNRKIPVLEDGPVIVWESLAIKLYLAQRYGGDPLYPRDPGERAAVLQWSFWVANEVEPFLWRYWQEEDAAAGRQLERSLRILDRCLSDADWVVGRAFSAADLNLESYIVRARRGGYALDRHPHLHRWIERCEARPARRRVRTMIEEFEAGADPAEDA